MNKTLIVLMTAVLAAMSGCATVAWRAVPAELNPISVSQALDMYPGNEGEVLVIEGITTGIFSRTRFSLQDERNPAKRLEVENAASDSEKVEVSGRLTKVFGFLKQGGGRIVLVAQAVTVGNPIIREKEGKHPQHHGGGGGHHH